MAEMTNEEAISYMKYSIESMLNNDNEYNLDYLCKMAIKEDECKLQGVFVLNRDEKEKWLFTIELEKMIDQI